MKLTIQEVHTYYDLVNSGLALPLEFACLDNTPGGSFIIPKLDEEDKVFFYDTISKTKIYPGITTVEKIKKAIDSQRMN